MRRLSWLICALMVWPAASARASSITDYTVHNPFYPPPAPTIRDSGDIVGIDVGSISADYLDMSFSYQVTAEPGDGPLGIASFSAVPYLMPGSGVSAVMTLCFGGTWDVGPAVSSQPTCSTADTLSLSLSWRLTMAGWPQSTSTTLNFTGTTTQSVTFDPVLTIGVLTQVHMDIWTLEYDAYVVALRNAGIPVPAPGPGLQRAEERFTPVPEPGTMILVGSGLLSGIHWRRRSRRGPRAAPPAS